MYHQQQRKHIIPNIIPGLLAAFQFILWLAIIGLESGSVYYDAGRGTIYAGYWCSSIFLITWISMLGFLCCNKSSGCGVYLVIINIINSIFSIILIIFTSLFVNNPCLCYSILCNVPPWDDLFDLDYYLHFGVHGCTSRTWRKLPVLKGLLSCAVLMLVSSLFLIIAYIIAYILSRKKQVSYPPIQSRQVPIVQQPPMIIDPVNQYDQAYVVQVPSQPYYYSQATSTPMEIRSHKF